MDNIFTPEEANKPVTFGDLLTILNSIVNDLGKNSIDYTDTLQEHTFEIINKLTDHLVEIRNDAEYKRIRDMNFVLNLISQVGHYDKDLLCKNYHTWCEEFDRLNKPQSDVKEKKDG
jgi:hypothetical protein